MTREDKWYVLELVVLTCVMMLVMQEITARDVEKRLLNIEGGINTQNFLLEELLND
jgi:hypothetical protein